MNENYVQPPSANTMYATTKSIFVKVKEVEMSVVKGAVVNAFFCMLSLMALHIM
jgi:hypothetical protein